MPGSANTGEILPPLTGSRGSRRKRRSVSNHHKKVEAGGWYASQHPLGVLLGNKAVLLPNK
eukprot:2581894-Prorocentrum_lima.AAC.1